MKPPNDRRPMMKPCSAARVLPAGSWSADPAFMKVLQRFASHRITRILDIVVVLAMGVRYERGPKASAGVKSWEFAVGTESIWHWIIVAAVVLLLFGRGKVSELMGDVARGIQGFRKAMAEDENGPTRPSGPEHEKDGPRTTRQ